MSSISRLVSVSVSRLSSLVSHLTSQPALHEKEGENKKRYRNTVPSKKFKLESHHQKASYIKRSSSRIHTSLIHANLHLQQYLTTSFLHSSASVLIHANDQISITSKALTT
ncbi:hypothetical protein EYC84_003836 [Monilinia fructicola]|uniref:Uncharacterized protein n=1 Tax=Monilinia fructicola TaxID=38448 RepID=A0A5M9K069_MONFR|nr:hypothetical protein EYC84_003836 [Monilinia fructicola]